MIALQHAFIESHRVTSYSAMVGFTTVRLVEALIKSFGSLWLAYSAMGHALRKDHDFQSVMWLISITWFLEFINSLAVATSLYLKPSFAIARAGVSVAGFFGALGIWYLAYLASAYRHQMAYMMAQWSKEERSRIKSVQKREERKRCRESSAEHQFQGAKDGAF